MCGGLQTKETLYDCLQFCCHKPESCDRVCRNHPNFADYVREIGTFDLNNVPRAQILDAPKIPHVVPVIFHGKKHTTPISSQAVALSLYQMFDRRSGEPLFKEHATLCKTFSIESKATIVLTGTARDAPIERWWDLGEKRRRAIIRDLKSIGIGLITSPNYSLFLDRPRWDNLHSIKRIAIVHEEFLSEGMPAGLHVNGRTETDFHRWTEYIDARPEITHLTYEFTTGTARPERRKQHAKWLATIAKSVNRPLHLIIRGGARVLPILSDTFAHVTLLETSIFMKTVKRQRAYIKENASLGWQPSPTSLGAPLDDLFADNLTTVKNYLDNLCVSTNGIA
ncbi:MAG: DUF4417 domain-containing protein [Nitrospinae bacterium]|nr:DUF4417 domain-containing protein [Nitrospinota bacterium]